MIMATYVGLFTVIVMAAAWGASWALAKWRGGLWLVLAYLAGATAGVAATVAFIALFHQMHPDLPAGFVLSKFAGPGLAWSLFGPLWGMWYGRRRARRALSTAA
jgi:hypothetical protein